MELNNTQYNNLNSRVSIEHQAELASMFDEKPLINNNEPKSITQQNNEKPKQYIKTNSSKSINDSNGFSSLMALISITIIVSIMTIFMAISIIMLK